MTWQPLSQPHLSSPAPLTGTDCLSSEDVEVAVIFGLNYTFGRVWGQDIQNSFKVTGRLCDLEKKLRVVEENLSCFPE